VFVRCPYQSPHHGRQIASSVSVIGTNNAVFLDEAFYI